MIVRVHSPTPGMYLIEVRLDSGAGTVATIDRDIAEKLLFEIADVLGYERKTRIELDGGARRDA